MALKCMDCKTELLEIYICRSALSCPRLLCPHCFTLYEPQYDGRKEYLDMLNPFNIAYARYTTNYVSYWKIHSLTPNLANTWI